MISLTNLRRRHAGNESVPKRMKPKICVLKTDGTNCDRETAHAFNLAGGEAEIIHINSLRNNYDPIKRKKVSLDDYHILAFPGGFSHGDYVAAGKIFAEDFKIHLRDEIKKFIADGKLIIGICNGFQVLVKMGLLPMLGGEVAQTASLTYNDNDRFECRWVRLAQPVVGGMSNNTRCIWTMGIKNIDLPIAHGEGRFIASPEAIEQMFRQGLVVFQYVNSTDQPTSEYPANPNGSDKAIAGICDPTGRIFGLMPHPERYNHPLNHPSALLQRIKGELPREGAGLKIFRNGVEYVKENFMHTDENFVEDRNMLETITYADAGVNIQAGEEVAENVETMLESTWDTKVIPNISGFKAVYDDGDDYLIGATDGVGTKLLIGIMSGKVDTIGQDLVAMCVNDLARVGAKPLFFLDYLAIGKLDPATHQEILKGIVEGCRLAGTSLLGGETAEMPGMYAEKHFDLAGFSLGRVNKQKIIDGKDIAAGAGLLGIESSGIHSNGYSLARKIFFDILGLGVNDYVEDLGKTVAEPLLEPTIIYTKPIIDLLERFPNQIQGMAHITGGGLPNKLPKALPEGRELGIEIDTGSWPVPKVFDFLAAKGPVSADEMRKTFNMGIGMVLVVSEMSVVPEMISRLREGYGLNAYQIGMVVSGEGVKYL